MPKQRTGDRAQAARLRSWLKLWDYAATLYTRDDEEQIEADTLAELVRMYGPTNDAPSSFEVEPCYWQLAR